MPTLKEILTDLRDKSMRDEYRQGWASVDLPRGLRVHYNQIRGRLLLERHNVTPSDLELSTVIKHFPVVLHPDREEWVTAWDDPATDSCYRMAEVKEVLDE